MIDPTCNHWDEYGKPKFIEEMLKEICENIAKKGSSTHFEEVFSNLYEFVEENIDKFLPEKTHD